MLAAEPPRVLHVFKPNVVATATQQDLGVRNMYSDSLAPVVINSSEVKLLLCR